MRIVTVNEEQAIYINGSAITPFIYKEQFNRDFLVDVSQTFINNVVVNQSLAMQILWALAKTHDFNTLAYDQWKHIIEVDDSTWQQPLINEINDKFTLRDRQVEDEEDEAKEGQLERYDLSLLANIFRMEIPLEIVNEMSLDTLLDFQEVYMGEGERKPRQATQNDIDAFFS